MSLTPSVEEIAQGVFANLRSLVQFDQATLLTTAAEAQWLAFTADGHQPEVISPGSLTDELTQTFLQLQQTGLHSLEEPESSQFRSRMAMPLLYRGEVTGALILASRNAGVYGDSEVELVRAFAAPACLAVQSAQLIDQVRSGRERLRTLSHRLVEIQEEERRNIARELHDQIGQMLTGLKLVLEMSERASPGKAPDLGEALGLVNELMARVRDLSLDLRPAMLDDLGLLPALSWHIERYAAQTRIAVQLKHRGVEDRRFDPRIETAAYRTIQEALTNVARHAQTDNVDVRLWAEDQELWLQIADQGRGFDLESTLASAGSSGLSGMQERIALLGGLLTIESGPGQGTLLTVELPLGGHLERRRVPR
jgi:signal transduction histidine kinase